MIVENVQKSVVQTKDNKFFKMKVSLYSNKKYI